MAGRYTTTNRSPLISSSSSSSHHHGSYEGGVDADVQDYWDDSGVPAPHRLSTAHAASPYPASPFLDAASLSPPRYHPGEMQQLYNAPSVYLSQSPYIPSLSSAPESLNHSTYMPTFESRESLYHKAAFDDDEESFDSRRNSTDAWGLYDAQHQGARNSLAQARDRYMIRKEAALSAAGNVYDFVPPKSSRFTPRTKKIMILAASLTTAIVCAIVIFFATRHNTNSTVVDGAQASSSKNKNGGGKSTAGVVTSDKNDPSQFTKDSRLHKSMFGLCYTPLHAQYPACGATQANVTEDIQLISQLTSRIRLYGSDCETSQLVLEAIDQTKVDMQVFLAVWVDDNSTTFQRQVDNIVDAVKKYGTDHIAGISVGNEYLLNGGSVDTLISRISSVNTTVNALPDLGKYIPIGTADAGSMITTQLATGADYIMANVHPWFGGVPVDQAAGWIYEYTNTNEPSTALLAPNKPTLYVAEAGWPTGANETSFETYQGAVAGIDQLNTFLSTFVCQSNTNVTQKGLQPSFIFEAFDEPWKDSLYGGVEAHWGLFDSNKSLKDGLVIPDCTAP
ncbi:uncharacterized protein MEPE_06444 [Melanopsichium pennsylvanicum]|uniref:glucan endo-1,3-beta-D-glucosidase n=1 Tax=Melanopsichium pennsylvanicum TaxID=63383 RepID=A0AAJ5C8P3_9BASI|nr:uncharacterized protein MEPE_06444 [Melanopsichium pennsylvanicum]